MTLPSSPPLLDPPPEVAIEPPLDGNALRVLEARYLLRDATGRPVETPRQLFWRVARGVAEAERAWGGDPQAAARELYPWLANLVFLPNSPTLMNAGRPAVGQLAACFVLPVEDTIDDIFQTVGDAARIQRTGGGTGFAFSRLRPRGDLVRTTGGRASGPVSFLRVFNAATDAIHQGGVRRGANMGVLRVDHPDVLEFVDVKSDPRELRNFNLSVAATDAFMQAVREDGEYALINPRTGGPVGRLRAREVFERIARRAWESGEPGLIFIDRVNAANPTPDVGQMESTNPCGELPLLPYESCNLGSIDVSKLVAPDGRDLDWARLGQAVRAAIRFLDDVIEANRYPLPAIEAITKRNRKVGLGVMGFADLLVALSVRYDSESGLALARRLGAFVQREAVEASRRLAAERGPFPGFAGSVYAARGEPPRRHATVTTIAPTGTIALIAGCSSGIEPLFALAYVRRALDGAALLPVVHPALERVARARGFWSPGLAQAVARTGTLVGVAGVPADVREVFRTALEIAPEWHVRMQAAFQERVENAVSKCLAAGTLLPTSRGLMRIEDFSDIEEEDSFQPVMCRTTTGGHRITSHYYAGVRPATRIRLDNGATLIGSTASHRVMTPTGWALLRDLRPDDMVVGELAESHGPPGQELVWESCFRGNAKRIPVPTRMTCELAKLLGMLAADGHTTLSTGCVGLTAKDDEVEREFARLCREVFGVEPKLTVDRRNDVHLLYLTSRNLARFVRGLIGSGSYEKRAPDQVVRGSGEEKLAFLAGLTLDGFVARDGLVVYSGMSKELAYQASEMCRSFGRPLVRVQRKLIQSAAATCHHVVVSNELQELVRPIEAHKRVPPTRVAFKVLIDPADAARMTLPCSDPRYGNLRLLKQTGKPFCKDTVADELGLPWRHTVHWVTEVEDAGEVELYDIEVEGSHRYVVNGIVSHNTINLPPESAVDDVRRAYLLAYELGCKGITVYRDGSRADQVLAVPAPAPAAAPAITPLELDGPGDGNGNGRAVCGIEGCG